MNIDEATQKHLRCDLAWLKYLKTHSKEDEANYIKICKEEWGNVKFD